MEIQAKHPSGVSLSPAERLICFTGRLAGHWLAGNRRYVLDEIMIERAASVALISSYMVMALRDNAAECQSFLMALQGEVNREARDRGA